MDHHKSEQKIKINLGFKWDIQKKPLKTVLSSSVRKTYSKTEKTKKNNERATSVGQWPISSCFAITKLYFKF